MSGQWAKRGSAEIEVVFLGTSSGMPTLHRNLPAVALVRQGEVFLFDCGEATQIQLRRAGVRMGRIRHLFVSHFHGDHVTGLPGLLMSFQMLDRTLPLSLYGPPGLRQMVRGWQHMVHTRFSYEIEFVEFDGGGTILQTDSYWVEAQPLDHRLPTLGFALVERPRPGRFRLPAAQALGIPPGPLFGRLQKGESVELADGRRVRPEEVLGPARRGRRIAYCTDTRPCSAAVTLARNADLLIHEATFAQALWKEAAQRGHSTARQAAEIACQADTRHLVLTHFSPRYQDVRPLVEEAREVFSTTWAAHDLARFQMGLPKEEEDDERVVVQEVLPVRQ